MHIYTHLFNVTDDAQSQSGPTLCDPMDYIACKATLSMEFPGKNTGVGCHVLIQGIFPTQGSNPCLLCLLHWQMGFLPPVPPGKPNIIENMF